MLLGIPWIQPLATQRPPGLMPRSTGMFSSASQPQHMPGSIRRARCGGIQSSLKDLCQLPGSPSHAYACLQGCHFLGCGASPEGQHLTMCPRNTVSQTRWQQSTWLWAWPWSQPHAWAQSSSRGAGQKGSLKSKEAMGVGCGAGTLVPYWPEQGASCSGPTQGCSHFPAAPVPSHRLRESPNKSKVSAWESAGAGTWVKPVGSWPGIVAWERQNVCVPVLAVGWDRPVARDNTGLEGDIHCSDHHTVPTGCPFWGQGGNGAAVTLLGTASTTEAPWLREQPVPKPCAWGILHPARLIPHGPAQSSTEPHAAQSPSGQHKRILPENSQCYDNLVFNFGQP